MAETRSTVRKGRFGRTIWWVGVLATLVLVAALAQGFEVRNPETLRPHLFLGLVASLILLFCHLWIGGYLRVLRREIRLHLASSGSPAGVEVPRPHSLWAFVAVILLLGSFLLGPAGLQGVVPYAFHAAAGFLALAAQVAGLWVEKRDLAASDRILDRLFAAERAA